MFSVRKLAKGRKWTNWAENIIAYPSQVKFPRSVQEIGDIVKEASSSGRTIRVTGAAHSFSPVAMPEDIALSLHHLRGLIKVDMATGEATFWAGTYLHEVGPLLANYGLALQNMGDIEKQTLAGAISTGTHGTGVTLGSLSSMVTAWSFVDGTGKFRECRRDNTALSESLHVSLGLLGILIQVTIQTIPLYSLHYVATSEMLQEALPSFQLDIRNNRHVEWYYFPGSEIIQIKRMNAVSVSRQSSFDKLLQIVKQQALENGLFYILSEACRIKPSITQYVSKVAANNITKGEKTGLGYEIYPSSRLVKFQETEHAIALDRFEECMEEIHYTLKQGKFQVHFPIECRTVAGESGYLSPTQNRESVYLAFHMYKGMDEGPYFEWVYDLMGKYGGRPHWGKMHKLQLSDITELYPQFTQFLKVREQLDPANVFMTSYMKKLFTNS